MRILVLSKRQYMNMDLLNDRYGRFRELPFVLSKSHEICGICLSYRPCNEGIYIDKTGDAQVTWHALHLKRLIPCGTQNYWQLVNTIGINFNPDLVWACSDAFHAILGVHVAKRLSASLVIDLYDNFESYRATSFPGVTTLFHRALGNADGITCISAPLASYVNKTCHLKGSIKIIGNAVPDGLFHPLDRSECRKNLGLPTEGMFIGTAGAISKSRGIDTLFKAFEILAKEFQDVHLVLAGPCDKDIIIPDNPRIHYLGVLPQEAVPIFLSSLNISVVCIRQSAFGNYCFPQKLYEAISCGIPTFVAGTLPMKDLLHEKTDFLFEPDNVADLTAKLRCQINNPLNLSLEVPTWDNEGEKLALFFQSIIDKNVRNNKLIIS